MSWRLKRQLFILGCVCAVLICAGAVFYRIAFVQQPTCFDGKKNGAETGADCGGECDLMCKNEMRPIDILWARAFPLSGSQVNAVAFVENRNTTATLQKIEYTFYIYDQNNILIATRIGTTTVSPNTRFYIFEHGIEVGNKIPARTLLVFGDIHTPWVRFPYTKTRDLDLKITDQQNSYGEVPRVRAQLQNSSLLPIRNISVRAIVFDADGNTIGASATKISELAERATTPLIFTWPRAFSGEPVRTELHPFINPFEQVYE